MSEQPLTTPKKTGTQYVLQRYSDGEKCSNRFFPGKYKYTTIGNRTAYCAIIEVVAGRNTIYEISWGI